MKTKTPGLFVLSMFLVAVFVSFTSAGFSNLDNNGVFNISNINAPNTISQTVGSFEITFDLEDVGLGGHDINWSDSTVNGGSSSISFSPDSGTTISSGSKISVTATINFNTNFDGEINGTVLAHPEGLAQNSTFDFSTTITESSNPSPTQFCADGAGAFNANGLTLNVDINNRGEGDEEEWLPLDTIEIEVEVENDRDDDAFEDVEITLALFDENGKDVSDDMIWVSEEDEQYDLGDVDENEEREHIFKFRVDPSEAFKTDSYRVMVKAEGTFSEDDEEGCIDFSSDFEEGTSSFSGGENTYTDIAVEAENDEEKMVIVDRESYPIPIQAFCGSQVSFSADVWNIGDEDFEDQIAVVLRNQELGVNQEEVLLGDFDAGDDGTVNFAFNVPQDAEEKQYILIMNTFYGYDEDDDNYDETSDEEFFVYLQVEGNCNSGGTATVSANLESGGRAGDELVVRAVITNTGNEQAEFLINPAGFGEWANSANAVPSSLILSPGSSRDVILTLEVNKDVSGQKTFNIEVISENTLVVSQPVSVLIEGKSGFFTGGAIGVNYLWGFAILNLIIVVAIIIVAIRILRR
ncbi:MAG: putative S-layer protein [Candidatus Pacearchaeota archaeon]